MFTSLVCYYFTNMSFFFRSPLLEWQIWHGSFLTSSHLTLIAKISFSAISFGRQFPFALPICAHWSLLSVRWPNHLNRVPLTRPCCPIWTLRGIAIPLPTLFTLRIFSCSASHHMQCRAAFHKDSIESVQLNSCYQTWSYLKNKSQITKRFNEPNATGASQCLFPYTLWSILVLQSFNSDASFYLPPTKNLVF